jgi:tRNA (adenine57-N1/adenine58-N1)-methyltransferase catalytic subunit
MTGKILIAEQGKKFYVRDISNDFHNQFGFLKATDMKKAKDGSTLVSNTGKEFTIISPLFIDLYEKMKRSAQIIPLKDVGSIITFTGINKNSKIVDAGAGSGALSCFLAHIAKEVVTYEIRDDFYKVVENNIKSLGLKNIKLKKKDIYEGISEKNQDLITLDLPEPWKVVGIAAKALKVGGFIASYSPTVPQVMDFVNEIKSNKEFVYIKTIEILEREWDVDSRKVRPKSQAIGHSGFITFARRIR